MAALPGLDDGTGQAALLLSGDVWPASLAVCAEDVGRPCPLLALLAPARGARQLSDRRPGAGHGPGAARRRHRSARGYDRHHRRRAERVLAAVPAQRGPAAPALSGCLPLPAGGTGPGDPCAHRPAGRGRTPHAARRGRMRPPRHRPVPAARRPGRGGRAGQAPGTAAARGCRHPGPAHRRRALCRPAGRTAPVQGLDRGGGPRASRRRTRRYSAAPRWSASGRCCRAWPSR